MVITYLIVSISWQAWKEGIMVWHVTKHRLFSWNQSKEIRLKYFNNEHIFDPDKEGDTIKLRLAMEAEMRIEASEIDLVKHFESIKKMQTNPLIINNSKNKIEEFKRLMGEFLTITNLNKLSFPHPDRILTNAGKTVIWDTLFKDDPYEILSYNELIKLMDFKDYFLKDVQLKHQNILNALPENNPSFYSGVGYVYLGGSIYTWLALISIQSLRKSGSNLPIEIMIPDSKQYDTQLCDHIMPRYNAKCVTFESVYGSVLKKFEIKGYQLKSFAILASSFEKILYLDSDMLPVVNPDAYFNSEIFSHYGLITWPDFWRRTSSPKLYETLNLQIGSPIRRINDFVTPLDFLYAKENLKDLNSSTNFHDLSGALPDWSTEAGIMLINKSTHFKLLLLSLYYNLNGPSGYYPLLSQGGAGEGDKETWPFAAHVLNLPWWQINKKPKKTYGTWIKDRNWLVDSGIVQVDLIDDFEGFLGLIFGQEQWRNEMVSKVGDKFAYNYDYSYGQNAYEYTQMLSAALGQGLKGLGSENNIWEPITDNLKSHEELDSIKSSGCPRDAFFHIHSPKLDPWLYVIDDKFTDFNGKQMRNFGDLTKGLGWDLELWIWQIIVENMCGESDPELTTAVREMGCFKNRYWDDICLSKKLQNHIEWLDNTGSNEFKNMEKVKRKWKLKGEERENIREMVFGKWNENF